MMQDNDISSALDNLSQQLDRVVAAVETQTEILRKLASVQGVDAANLPVSREHDAVRVVVVGDERD